MLRGIYSVANAMETAARNQEIVSDNLAHATTTGYRRQALLQESSGESFLAQPTAASGVPTQSSRTYLYVDQGVLQQTGNPLDLAVSGEAFFVVEGPDGPLYTRNGSFEVGLGGELRTRGGGYRVSGAGGDITIPTNTAAPVTVGTDGTVSVGAAQVGRLQLASFANPQDLRRVGTSLYDGDGLTQLPPTTARVEQGFREASNVQPVQEVISMMVGLRHYEAASKALQAISDAVSQNTRTTA